MREPIGFKQTAMVSLAAHAAAFALLALVPSVFPVRTAAPRVVMNISLGGSPGPRTGGREMIGGRAIQAAQPAVDPKLAKSALPNRQPPSTAMADPRLKPKVPPKDTAASKDPKGTTGRGAETRAGSAAVETGAKGVGFGLSSSGGGGTGGTLEVENFCCREYLDDMIYRITSNWNQQQPASGTVLMKYTIRRNGEITDIEVERSSNNPFLDRASELALRNTRRFQPLPAQFPDDRLIVHLTFNYERKK